MGRDVGDDDRRSELGRFEDWKREPFMERWHHDRLRRADQLGKVLVRHAAVDHHPVRLEAEPDHEINKVDRLLVQDVSDDDQSQIPTVTDPRPNEPGGGGGEVLVRQAVAQGEHVPLEGQAERPRRTGPPSSDPRQPVTITFPLTAPSDVSSSAEASGQRRSQSKRVTVSSAS